MARPLSEEKAQAVIDAATETIATQGLGASTASIAKRAGVAEGTLFRYFATKDILLVAVFDYWVEKLEIALSADFNPTASVEHRTRTIWNNYIDWGIANPTVYSTLNQLAVSGKLSPEQLDRPMKFCGDLGVRPEEIHFEGLTPAQSTEFKDSILTAIANTTIGLAAAQPELTEAYKYAGFLMVWKATSQHGK